MAATSWGGGKQLDWVGAGTMRGVSLEMLLPASPKKRGKKKRRDVAVGCGHELSTDMAPVGRNSARSAAAELRAHREGSCADVTALYG